MACRNPPAGRSDASWEIGLSRSSGASLPSTSGPRRTRLATQLPTCVDVVPLDDERCTPPLRRQRRYLLRHRCRRRYLLCLRNGGVHLSSSKGTTSTHVGSCVASRVRRGPLVEGREAPLDRERPI